MLSQLKNAVRGVLPAPIVNAYRKIRYGKTWIDMGRLPVGSAFTEIYRRNLWGGDTGHFYSGPGSDAAVAEPYVDAIRAFMRERGVRSIVDIGCGDFRVGQQLVSDGVSYHGVDVVPDLIESHRRNHAAENIRFSRVDATTEVPPAADLCLVRQVLQHLSNAQISAVLEHCRQYPNVIVTEHMVPASPTFQANVDIRHGVETRVDLGSCVQLDAPPFGWTIKKKLCEVWLPDGSLIQTLWVKPPADAPANDAK